VIGCSHSELSCALRSDPISVDATNHGTFSSDELKSIEMRRVDARLHLWYKQPHREETVSKLASQVQIEAGT